PMRARGAACRLENWSGYSGSWHDRWQQEIKVAATRCDEGMRRDNGHLQSASLFGLRCGVPIVVARVRPWATLPHSGEALKAPAPATERPPLSSRAAAASGLYRSACCAHLQPTVSPRTWWSDRASAR